MNNESVAQRSCCALAMSQRRARSHAARLRRLAAALAAFCLLPIPARAGERKPPAATDSVAAAVARAADWVTQPASDEQIEAFAPAAEIRYRLYSKPKPLRVWIARIDMSVAGVRATVTLPADFADEDEEFETLCADTLQFARQRGVQLAVNTSPFAPFRRAMGMPMNVIGLSASRGDVYSSPDERFGAMYIDPRGRVTLQGPPLDATEVWHVVPGFRMLVDDGKVVLTPQESDSRFGGVNPRTAVGVDKTGNIVWLVVVDGRQADVSHGITLAELTSLFLSLGAWDALNLDGGGSSTFVLEDQAGCHRVINTPSGRQGTLRQVANNLGFYLPGTPVAATPSSDSSFREDIVRLASSRRGGGYQWKGDGVSKTIMYGDKPLLSANPEGTFCCGATLELFLDVYCKRRYGYEADRATGSWFHDWPRNKILALKQGWWGMQGATTNPLFPEDVRKTIREKQVFHTLPWAEYGEPVTNYRLLQRGDFVQFWRKSGSGHSVVYWGRDFDDKGRERFWYWSSQPKPRYAYPLQPGGEPVKTPGYGVNWEYLGKDIDPARIYGVRLVEPAVPTSAPAAG
jgi:hypothetical protein